MIQKLERESGNLINIAGGFSAVCFIDGDKVIKITEPKTKPQQAVAKLAILQREYDLMQQFLGNNIIPTEFKIRYGNKKFYIQLTQPLVKGEPLRQNLNPTDPLQRDFFEKCLSLYESEGITPDLIPDIMPDPSLGMKLKGKYTYRSGPNVYLVNGVPTLIDTTLNRGLRHAVTGPLLSFLIASKVESLLEV